MSTKNQEPGCTVHIYAVVRVPVKVAGTSDHLAAIKIAEETTDLEVAIRQGIYAEEIINVLVDTDGDEEYQKTTAYKLNAAGDWVPVIEVPTSDCITVTCCMRSKTLGTTDTSELRVYEGENLWEKAQNMAASYGATLETVTLNCDPRAPYTALKS